MNDYRKPVPRGDRYNGEFYQFCKQHELRFQRCTQCQTWRHMPREMCPQCGSLDWSWERSNGKGKLYSWTVIHRALHPGFVEDVPYAAAIVELDEGVRMVSHVTGLSPEALQVGRALEVTFDDVTPEVSLPKFKPV